MLGMDPVRQNSGGVAAATSGAAVVVSFTGGDQTEAGNTLIVFLAAGNNQVFSNTPPSGWETIGTMGNPNDVHLAVFLRGPTQGLAAGESSWNFTPVNAPAGPVRWTVLEYEGIASGSTVGSAVIDAAYSGSALTGSGTTAVGTTSLTSTYDGLAVSMHVSYNPSAVDTWGSHTDGFTEIVEGSQAGSSSDNITLSVSALPVQRIGTYGATATCSRTLTGTNAGIAFTVVLNAAGAHKAANLNYIDGAEHGLVTGNTLGTANFKILETVTAGVSVSSTAARSGGFGWLFTSTAAACNWTLPTLTTIGPVYKRYFRFPTLPAADLEFWGFVTTRVRFIQSTGKIGIKLGTGAEVVSDQAITANQWFSVDVYRTTSTLDWAVDYNAELSDTTAAVLQTPATGSGGTSISHTLGWTTASTATMHSDDGAGSTEASHFPLPDLRILPLKVDPAGTPSISGTSTNFGVMTNNGTIAAWNAANARDAIDDIPPNISGTADAAVCVAAHASDYALFPFETYDLAANGVSIRAVRGTACIWAASATTATIRVIFYDGTTTYTISEGDPGADSTTPAWVTRMLRPASGRTDWTQAMVDALAMRMGSNDATPDIGIHSAVIELAVAKAQPEELFGSAGDPVHVTVGRDPDTNAIIDMDVTTVGKGATVNYELDQVAQTQIVAAADTTEHRDIGGTDFQSVNRIELTPHEPA